MNPRDLDPIADESYCGRILTGDYSPGLKRRLADYIDCYRALERTGNPAILYISAWHEETREIWYEFVSRRFTDLLACKPSEAAGLFRESVMDRVIYKALDEEGVVEKEVRSQEEVSGTREALREDVKKKGMVDVVYKISLRSEKKDAWLKDLATVEAYEGDKVYLSLGSLIDVTKEMKAEEIRVEKERLKAALQMAGAVCHELNQPLQGISGYSETLLLTLARDASLYEKIKKINELSLKMGQITKKLMRITRYETKDYVEGVQIVDIDRSSGGGI